MLSESQVEKCVDWLLENGSDPVKYLTHLHLLDADPSSIEMRAMWGLVESDPCSVEIFSKQERDGSWCSGGSWAPKPSYVPKGGCTPVSPKYVTTVWMLSILGDMGYDVADERVRRACDYVMGFQRADGVLEEDRRRLGDAVGEGETPRNVPCRMSIMMAGLAKAGMGRDPRLGKSFDLMLRWQREDGGWLNEGHLEGTISPYKVWSRGCPWVTHFATTALFHSGDPAYGDGLVKGLNFLVWHLEQKRDDEIRRFFWHGHNMVPELLMFSEAGVGTSSRPVKTLLGWLEGMHDSDEGCFRYRGKPISKMSRKTDGATPGVLKYRLFHLIEDDWLTYYMTRIEANLGGR